MRSSFKKRIKLLAVFSAFFILIILISSPVIITWAVNTLYVKDRISSVIHQSTGLKIDSSTFSLTLFPLPGVKMNQLTIAPNDQVQVKIDSLKLNLDLQELLQGNLLLGKILIAHPEIEFLGSAEGVSEKQTKIIVSKFIDVISKGFEFFPEDQDEIEFVITKGVSEYFKQIDGTVVVLKEEKKIQIDTALKGIQFSPSQLAGTDFGTYVDLDSVSIEELKFNTTLTIPPTVAPPDSHYRLQGNCSIIKPKLTSKKGHLLLDTDLIYTAFEFSQNQQHIIVNPTELNYPAGSVGIDFLNTPKKEAAHLQFFGQNLHVSQAREMSRVLLKDVYVAQTLFDILLDGFIPQIEVSFHSRDLKSLLNEHHLKLSGNIKNGKVHIPKTQLIASEVYGAVTINDGILGVRTKKGMIQTSKIEVGTLAVDLLNYEDVPFKGEFPINLDLSMLPQTLITLLPKTLLAEELSKVHNVVGTCKSVLNLELKPGSDDLIVKVKTGNFSAHGTYDRIPEKINIEAIKVEYQPDIILLKDFTGVINGSKIQNLNTIINFKNDPRIDIQKGSAHLDLTVLIPWLMTYKTVQDIIFPIRGGTGDAFVSSINISGPLLDPEHWQYDASGSINNSDLTTRTDDEQIKNLSCQFQISDKGNAFMDIQAKIISLNFLDHISDRKYLNSIQTPFHLKNAQIRTQAKPSSFKGDLLFSTGPQLHLEASGEKFDFLEFNFIRFIDSDISNAQIYLNKNKNKPLFHFNGKFDTLSLPKILKPKSHIDNKLNEITGGQPIRIYTDDDKTLNIITEHLDLNSFLSSSKASSGGRQLLTEDLINFKAQTLKIKKLTFTDVDTKISLKKDHTYVRLKHADLCALETRGYINVKNGKIYANVPIETPKNDNIQFLLSCLLQKEKFMDGPYSFSGNLSSNGILKNELLNKIQGSFKLKADNGRIYKLTLLSRILSVLNVSKVFQGNVPSITQNGFAYKNITIKADIKDSIIHLTHAVIDAQDMTMIFSGELDPLNDRIDLTCLVAPFKTVDLIIEKIPILNTLLGGRLVSVPVKASGKLSDPSVIPLHPSAVGEGLIDMMTRIVKSPITLWDKIVNEEE